MANKDSEINSILLVIAMEQEALPLVRSLNLEMLSPLPFPFGLPAVAWKGKVGRSTVHLVWCGRDDRFGVNNVATTAASVTTYAALNTFGRPDIVLSVGTAGGFSQRGARIGDVFLSTKCVFHARRIPETTKAVDGDQNKSCNTLEEYGFGHFRSPNLMGLARSANVKLGVVTTSDSLDCTERDMELMMSEGATVKEMEAASVAWVCYHANIPFVAIKVISDIVDEPQGDDDKRDSEKDTTRDMFEKNFDCAVDSLKEKVGRVLKLLDHAKLSELGQSRLT